MSRIEAPEYFPYRLLIFNADGTFTIRSFNDRVVRDREARMLPDGTPALAVDVVATVNGGDYPTGLAEIHPKIAPKPRRRYP